MKMTQFRNSFLLFLAAFIWGVAFVSQSKGMEYMGPLTFNGTRSLLGAVVLIPLVSWNFHGTWLFEEAFILNGKVDCF